jgi:hypothetical protein
VTVTVTVTSRAAVSARRPAAGAARKAAPGSGSVTVADSDTGAHDPSHPGRRRGRVLITQRAHRGPGPGPVRNLAGESPSPGPARGARRRGHGAGPWSRRE